SKTKRMNQTARIPSSKTARRRSQRTINRKSPPSRETPDQSDRASSGRQVSVTAAPLRGLGIASDRRSTVMSGLGPIPAQEVRATGVGSTRRYRTHRSVLTLRPCWYPQFGTHGENRHQAALPLASEHSDRVNVEIAVDHVLDQHDLFARDEKRATGAPEKIVIG